MSNSRFSFVNYCANVNAYVMNGTGGTAPARTETLPYAMERVLDDDRMTVWRAGAGSLFDVSLDGIGGVSCSCAAVLGTGDGSGTTFKWDVLSRAVYDGGIPGWTARFSTSTRFRDVGASFTLTGHEYWRFIPFLGGYTAGTFWVGPVVDLGIQFSPSSSSSPNRNRIEQRYPDGSMIINDLGPSGRDIRLLFANVRTTMADTLETLSEQHGSFLYLDPRDRAFEVICPQGSVEVVQNFVDNYSVVVQLTVLS